MGRGVWKSPCAVSDMSCSQAVSWFWWTQDSSALPQILLLRHKERRRPLSYSLMLCFDWSNWESLSQRNAISKKQNCDVVFEGCGFTKLCQQNSEITALLSSILSQYWTLYSFTCCLNNSKIQQPSKGSIIFEGDNIIDNVFEYEFFCKSQGAPDGNL